MKQPALFQSDTPESAMRKLLQEHWDELLSDLQAKKKAFLAQVLAEHPRPDVIYCLESYRTIQAMRVDDVAIHVNVPYIERKPTKENVSALRTIVEGFNPTLADVYLCYSYGNTSGAVKLSEFLNGERYATTQGALLSKQQELIAKYAPRFGYAPCQYCGTQRLEKDLKPRTIFAQQYPHGQKIGMYCFDGPCGGYDQMAHEG